MLCPVTGKTCSSTACDPPYDCAHYEDPPEPDRPPEFPHGLYFAMCVAGMIVIGAIVSIVSLFTEGG